MSENRKQKLTLSVDAAVVEKAKNLGWNISEITESVLRSATFVPTGTDTQTLYLKYKELFGLMLPHLSRYNTWVTIGKRILWDAQGNDVASTNINLGPKGMFSIQDFDLDLHEEFSDIMRIDMTEFCEPSKILANFIDALSQSEASNREKMAQLEMVRRVLEAISPTLNYKFAEKATQSDTAKVRVAEAKRT